MKTLALVSLALALPSTALADGDGALNPLLMESGEGYGLVSAGVGLAGHTASTVTPITSGTLEQHRRQSRQPRLRWRQLRRRLRQLRHAPEHDADRQRRGRRRRCV